MIGNYLSNTGLERKAGAARCITPHLCSSVSTPMYQDFNQDVLYIIPTEVLGEAQKIILHPLKYLSLIIIGNLITKWIHSTSLQKRWLKKY